MEDLICSLGECDEVITGSGVLLADDYNFGINWEEQGFRAYNGSEKSFVVLHPVCFERVIQELVRMQGMTALMLVVGFAGQLKADLEM